MDWTLLLLGSGIWFVGMILPSANRRLGLFVYDSGSLSAKRAIIAFLLGAIIADAGVTAALYPTYRSLVDIQQHGQRAMADVLSLSRKCDRHCHSYANYRYEVRSPSGKDRLFLGNDQVGLEDGDLDYIQQHRKVPIAYAIDDPNHSAANFRDYALTSKPANFWSMFQGFLLLFPGLGGVAAIALASIRRSNGCNGIGTASFPFDRISARKRNT